MESQFIPISHTIQIAGSFSSFNTFMHTYRINSNNTNVTKLTTNQKLAKTSGVAGQATHSRQVVQGKSKKIGLNTCAARRFLEKSRNTKKTTMNKFYNSIMIQNIYSYDSRMKTTSKNSPNLDFSL